MKFVGGLFAYLFAYWVAAMVLNQLAWKWRHRKDKVQDREQDDGNANVPLDSSSKPCVAN